MKKVIRLTESDLVRLVEKITSESEVDESIIDDIKDKYRGLKGVKRGYGMDYFENMSKLQRLVSKLQKLDGPNREVIKELTALQSKVQNLNMPQQRKDALLTLIDRSVKYFNYYDSVNSQIIQNIGNLNIDNWS